MDFLATCFLEESQQYTGKLVVPTEDGGKPGKVYLNILCNNGDRSLIKHIGGNVKCVTYVGNMSGFEEETFEETPVGVFHEVPLEEFSVEGTASYNGVTTLVRLPDGYSNMRYLYDICSQRPDVRVIGGNLLGIEGVRIGRFDNGHDKLAPVFNGVYDSFLEVGLADLGNLTELARKAKKKESSKGEAKERKKKSSGKEGNAKPKGNKILNSFSCLFGNSEAEEF